LPNNIFFWAQPRRKSGVGLFAVPAFTALFQPYYLNFLLAYPGVASAKAGYLRQSLARASLFICLIAIVLRQNIFCINRLRRIWISSKDRLPHKLFTFLTNYKLFFYLCRPLKKPCALDYLQDFSIQFSGLANGTHRFEFQVGDKFFECLEYAVIERGNVNVDVELEKTTTLITLLFSFNGEVEVTCDRCAISYLYPVEGKNRLILQFGEGEGDEDELIFLSRGEFEFNIAQHIYEYIALALPLRIVPCEEIDDTSICDLSVKNRLETMPDENKESGSGTIDPRWEKLKGLGSNEPGNKDDFNND